MVKNHQIDDMVYLKDKAKLSPDSNPGFVRERESQGALDSQPKALIF